MSTTRQDLDRATEDRARAARLDRLLAATDRDLDAARARCVQADEAVAREEKAAAALDHMSLSRLLASVRGTTALERDAHAASVAAASVTAARARSDVADLQGRYARLRDERASLGDVEARYDAVLRAAAADGDPGVREEAAQELARRTQLRELEEAIVAADRARSALERAANELGSADSWSTYDTFFDGGVLSSAMKHDRLDSAARFIHDAQQTTAALSRELADVDLPPVQMPHIDGFTRGVDIWFDNLFTDLAVRGKIKDARRDVDSALTAVRALQPQLRERARALRD